MLRLRSNRTDYRPEVPKPIDLKWPLYILCAAATVLLAAGGVAVYHSSPAVAANSSKELISVGQGFIRGAIREELKASFASDEETRVEPLADKRFLVTGWVDVISEDGDVARQNFSCVIHKNLSNVWEGEKISIIPQEL